MLCNWEVAVEARRAHYPEVVGSNPLPATKITRGSDYAPPSGPGQQTSVTYVWQLEAEASFPDDNNKPPGSRPADEA
jgi:hypothetical protein